MEGTESREMEEKEEREKRDGRFTALKYFLSQKEE